MQEKKQFYKEANHYLWDEPYLFETSVNDLMHICVVGKEAKDIMWHCHVSSVKE